jgi:glutamate racemase
MIEEGRAHDDPVVDLVLRDYLKSLIEKRVTALVLGCTHYPLYAPAIQQIVGERVRVIDSAAQCAEDVARRLAADGVSADPLAAQVMEDRERIAAFVTDDPGRFQRLAPRFLGFEVDRPTLVAPEVLYRTIDTSQDHRGVDDDEPLLRLPA